MSNRTIKKKSSHLSAKIKLREMAIKDINDVNVLDCYHGNGEIWTAIKKKRPEIYVLGIEKNESKSPFEVIKGDNDVIIKSINIERFNVIDFDAYTSPLPLIEKTIRRCKKGTIFIYTFNINRMAGMPLQLKRFRNTKIKTIENKYIQQRFSAYLHELGIEQYTEIEFSDNCFLKKYGYFIVK